MRRLLKLLPYMQGPILGHECREITIFISPNEYSMSRPSPSLADLYGSPLKTFDARSREYFNANPYPRHVPDQGKYEQRPRLYRYRGQSQIIDDSCYWQEPRNTAPSPRTTVDPESMDSDTAPTEAQGSLY